MVDTRSAVYGSPHWPKKYPDGSLYRQWQRDHLLWSHPFPNYGGAFMKYLKKAASGGGKSPEPLSSTDAAFAENYPALFEYMTVVEWSKGQSRETLSLRLFAEDGRWKVCLTDRETGRVAFVTGDSVEGLLLAADEQLRAGNVDWRPDKYAKKRK